MKNFYYAACITLLFAGCNNLEDAELTKRNTFIRFYEGANSFVAAEAHETKDGGFIMAGSIRIDGDDAAMNMLVIKTNRMGIKEWETIIPGGTVSSIKRVRDYYVIVGDSVKLDPGSTSIEDLVNTASRLIELDTLGNVISDKYYFRNTNSGKRIDYHTSGLTTDAQGNYITLGTHTPTDSPESADITCLNGVTLDTIWRQKFDYINRDYNNTRELFYSDGKVLWGASITESNNNFTTSYLAVPVIMENSAFINSNYFGQEQEDDQFALKINDLKKSDYGFAAIGSYAEPDGSKGNMFFIKIDENGNFLRETIRYFDGNNNNIVVDASTTSTTEDSGDALTKTRDGGFVLAGSTKNLNSGGRDIWLVKLNVSGDVIWSKTLGGRFNEKVTSIEEISGGRLLLCGTIYEGATDGVGLTSIFLITTDANGDLLD